MKLIVITQKADMNDGNLGFFHRWLEKLSEKTSELKVICLSEGKHQLPANVEVLTLGKEKGYSKLRQFFRLQNFLFKNLPQANGVFVHMCPIYAVLSFPLVRIFRKKFVMFYAHGAVHIKLRMAEKVVDKILTSSLAGCRLRSKKIKAIGQGIDIDLFRPTLKSSEVGPPTFNILYAARLNPTKDPETLIRAIDILVNQQNIKKIRLKIIGHALVKSEREYLRGLKKLVSDFNLGNCVEFIDGVPYSQMSKEYQETSLFVNPSSTGSLDKVVLEAMASGCLVLNCNEAYQEILAEKYMFRKGDAQDLAQKIVGLIESPKDASLRETVVKNHNLDNFIQRIIAQFNE